MENQSVFTLSTQNIIAIHSNLYDFIKHHIEINKLACNLRYKKYVDKILEF